ncbi:type II toxin-antitoxin system VapC family toxin [Streptococcus henryi]|jgi:predicted nucleic acid-binding protein|uniref:type II toxin-antitoxin system VapC family toxin n=1 Tax=Streptococcus henryi TaxID=439219 RepID=UPI0003755B13|nr:PIN domain-containing protein [Streptococcus henryi]
MKVLLDVNVIIDFYLNRDEASKEIILKSVYGIYTAHISTNMLTDIYYILDKNGKEAGPIVEKLLQIFQVLDVTKDDCLRALTLKMPDFEDSVVAAVALSNNIDILVTRNESDFKGSGLVVYSPDEFLERLRR